NVQKKGNRLGRQAMPSPRFALELVKLAQTFFRLICFELESAPLCSPNRPPNAALELVKNSCRSRSEVQRVGVERKPRSRITQQSGASADFPIFPPPLPSVFSYLL